MAIDTSSFKTGLTIVQDGEVWQIVEFQHVKPGKGGAFVRTKLKQVKSGKTIDKTFRAGEKMEQAILERRKMQFLYGAGETFTFMDMESFEQIDVQASLLSDKAQYLTDQLEVMFVWWGEAILDIELPTAIEATVTETDPGVRGDTASGGNKPATIESGAVVTVPLFINIGDRIKVDTRTGVYLERVSS